MLANARHPVLYIIACVLATALAAWALRGNTRSRGALFWGAAALVVLALCGSVLDVYALRGSRARGLGACGAEIAQCDGYTDARWNSRLALAFLPASVLLLVGAARSTRPRSLTLAAASVPLALLGWNVVLLREVTPGQAVLYSGVCRLWDARDDVRSDNPSVRSRGCLDLQHFLDPKNYEYEKDPAVLSRALPELSTLRKRCLDDLLADIAKVPDGGRANLSEFLGNPLIGPDQRDAFAGSLNAIDRAFRDVRCSRDVNLCIGSLLPSDVAGVDAATAVRLRFSLRWLARELSDCVVRHDGVFRFTVEGTVTTEGALQTPSIVDVEGLSDEGRRALVACAAEAFPSFSAPTLPVASSIRYRLWGAAPGIDGSR